MSRDHKGKVLYFFGVNGTRSRLHEDKSSAKNPEQLSLPLNQSHFLVFVKDSEVGRTASTFIDFLREYRPKYLLDFRVTPRMDLIAASRQATFKTLSQLNVEYVDFMGRIGVHSTVEFESQAEIARLIASILPISSKTAAPLVCLFDDDRLMEDCRKILPEATRSFFSDGHVPNVSDYRSGLLAV